jgi:predicted enzyme related to lactoylglutathione lyase
MGEIIVRKRRKVMANPFVHVELHTQDPQRAKNFYKELFDWKLEDMPDMEYTVIDVGETGRGGGIMKSPMPDAAPQWVPYILVDDVAASTAKAKSLGAAVLQDVTEIPGIGSFSMLVDPTGAAFALFLPKMPI